MVMLSGGPITIGGMYLGTHFLALATMMTLIDLNAILLGVLAKVAIATYHPMPDTGLVRWLRTGNPIEYLVFSGAFLGVVGLLVDVALVFRWVLISGDMDRTVHLAFVTTTACVAGFTMVLAGFLLKLLLDNLEDNAGQPDG